MKFFLSLLSILVLLIECRPTFGEGTPFALVELFTSEGCSSCPPAERVLAAISKGAEATGDRIYLLAFHVDYWNRLGWKDPFSRAAFSSRQRSYGRAFDSNRIYTPQMVVNGKEEFVGSNRSRAELIIRESLSQKAEVDLTIDLDLDRQSRELTISYEISESPDNAALNIALVEDGLATEILSGENEGRTLSHERVVRVFETVELKGRREGEFDLTIPANVSIEKGSIVGYVQIHSKMEILGAIGVGLGNRKADGK